MLTIPRTAGAVSDLAREIRHRINPDAAQTPSVYQSREMDGSTPVASRLGGHGLALKRRLPSSSAPDPPASHRCEIEIQR